MTDPVVVIGGGVGGLAAAIRLAAAGQEVVLLEKNATVGGKMGEWRASGYRWDTGPSVITMRPVIEALFTAAGRSVDDYLTLLPVDPLTRYFYPDGTVLDATADLSRMLPQIEALDPRDVDGYLRFLASAAELHRITGPVFTYGPAPTWRSFLQVPPRDALTVDPLRTLQRRIERDIHSPHLRQLLGRFATYVGASPFRAPATLGVIAHVELSGGVWYPRGGIFSIAEALARLARELGVTIQTHTPVEAISVHGGRAVAVIAGGMSIPAQAVISNVDVATTYARLLPQARPIQRRLERLRRMETSCSGFVMLLGVAGAHPNLGHHNILFSSDYRREFAEIFAQGQPPGEPTLYVAITSRTDATHAPPGGENWFVMANAPALGHFDWDKEANTYRQRVLDRLAAVGHDIRDQIVVEKMLTPLDLAAQSGAHRGALYGTSMNSTLAPWRRPTNRCSEIERLYFAGGTTHPGGGVPMVMLSGKVAAELTLADIRSTGHE